MIELAGVDEPLTTQELIEYNELVAWLNNPSLYELNIPERLQKKIDFLQELANTAKTTLRDLVDLFKQKVVFKFFLAIRWSLQRLYKIAKRGYTLVHDVTKIIGEYTAQTQVGKWTEEELRNLDEWLKKHPKISRISGIGVAGILIIIWLNMTFTGKFSYDFDLSQMVKALEGDYSLTDIFSGPGGMQLLFLFATGALLGLSFPWPSPKGVQFITALIVSLRKVKK